MASSGKMSTEAAGATSSPGNNVSGSTGRRPSQEKNALFSGLHSIKRNSTDEASAARRSSFHDAQAEPGFIGKMWHNFTRGPAPSSIPSNPSPPPTQLK